MNGFQGRIYIMEKDIYKILGDVTRGCRLQLGWSQEELGERAGLHASYIGQIGRLRHTVPDTAPTQVLKEA